MKIYISGPITYATGPDPFGPVKTRLEEMGYQTLNPKDVPACADRSCTRLPHEIEKGWEHSWACFLKHDILAMIRTCDTIIMLDGWQDSHGARLELHVASSLGFNVLFASSLDSLPPLIRTDPDGSVRLETSISLPEPEPLVHQAAAKKHGPHWDVTCSACPWTAVNILSEGRARVVAVEHGAGLLR